jgi:hypothetical protein
VNGDARISRQELAAVAVALLLPIPLLVASGLRFPLPGAIERGVASLTPGGGFDAPVVEAAPARRDEAPPVPSRTESVGGASAVGTPVVSSAGVERGSGASSTRNEKREGTTPAETDRPSPPEPHTDDTTPSGDGDGGGGGSSGGDTSGVAPEPSAAPPVESIVESIIEIDAEAAGASVQVTVTDSGVTVDTGGPADVGPPLELPLELPLAPPTVPLP